MNEKYILLFSLSIKLLLLGNTILRRYNLSYPPGLLHYECVKRLFMVLLALVSLSSYLALLIWWDLLASGFSSNLLVWLVFTVSTFVFRAQFSSWPEIWGLFSESVGVCCCSLWLWPRDLMLWVGLSGVGCAGHHCGDCMIWYRLMLLYLTP
jgi:hypothetical protein